jgi:hypothetical protein
MKNIKHEVSVWVQLVTFVGLWVGILYATRTGFVINLDSVKKLPEVVTAYLVLHFAFTRWAWRWPVFRGWLVPFPDLQGTWSGELKTTWRDPVSGQTLGPIPVTVCIRQTFSSLSVVMFTAESMSYSMAASLSEADDSGLKRLSYTYTNTPRVGVRERSIVHDGAAVLRIVNGPIRRLEGEYWTNRKSTGDLRLTYKSAQLAERFQPPTPLDHFGCVGSGTERHEAL